MSKMNIISPVETQQVLDIIYDLAAIADPSEYLKTEVDDVMDMLKNLESISTETYLSLNQLKESLKCQKK